MSKNANINNIPGGGYFGGYSDLQCGKDFR